MGGARAKAVKQVQFSSCIVGHFTEQPVTEKRAEWQLTTRLLETRQDSKARNTTFFNKAKTFPAQKSYAADAGFHQG